MGIFDKGGPIPERKLKEAIKRDTGVIPKTGGKKFYEGDRMKIEKEVFGNKYGSQISKEDYKDAIKHLDEASHKAPDSKARADAQNKLEYLKRIGGRL